MRNEIVPAPHFCTVIDGDFTHGCVWENETDTCVVRQVKFRNDGFEVVTISAEPVKPDDGGFGRPVAREPFDELERFSRHEQGTG